MRFWDDSIAYPGARRGSREEMLCQRQSAAANYWICTPLPGLTTYLGLDFGHGSRLAGLPMKASRFLKPM